MKTPLLWFRLLSLSTFYFLLSPSAFPQGSIVPTTAPNVPIMKTLDQIEPRKEINATNTPGDADSIFRISQSGSYYLSGDVNVVTAGKAAIEIGTSNVVIDLNGFVLRGSAGTVHGIQISNSVANVTIRNGTITQFGNMGVFMDSFSGAANIILESVHVAGNAANGIRLPENCIVRSCIATSNGGVGISVETDSAVTDSVANLNTGNGIVAQAGSTLSNCSASSNAIGILTGDGCSITNCASRANTLSGISASTGSVLSHCSASSNTGDGIVADVGSTLTACTAKDNGGTYGISAGEGSTLTSCTAFSNDVEFGIHADLRSTLTNCTASGNNSAASDSWGISAGAQSTVSNCTASGNLNSNGAPTGTTGGGILAGGSSTVQNCTVVGNKGDGIQIASDSRVVGNNCDSNEFGGGDAAGIHSTGADNRIEGNNVTDSDRGIDVDSTGSLIIKNSASGNTTNYDIAIGNVAFVVAATATTSAIAGSSGGIPPGGTPFSSANDPWANFSY